MGDLIKLDLQQQSVPGLHYQGDLVIITPIDPKSGIV